MLFVDQFLKLFFVFVVFPCLSWKQVAKQWYDFERSSFLFVKQVKGLRSPLTFKRVSDFDDNGMIYWIGSNAK